MLAYWAHCCVHLRYDEHGTVAQAMDRAHRLGQRRTVNVYRVLTRGTLEERIMGTQRFKLDTVRLGGAGQGAPPALRMVCFCAIGRNCRC